MRTRRILKRAGITANIRFSKSDRDFLGDLGKTGILSEEMASCNHYKERKSGAERTLSRFVNAGILERFNIHSPDGKKMVSYRFSNDQTARAFGGRYVASTTSRSDYHELLTAEAYFKLGKPIDFRIALQFTNIDKQSISKNNINARILPDAIATVDGALTYIEADAGHYTKRQIKNKMEAWGNTRQFWVQPTSAKVRVPQDSHIQAIRI